MNGVNVLNVVDEVFALSQLVVVVVVVIGIASSVRASAREDVHVSVGMVGVRYDVRTSKG